jgi:cell division protein ZapE
MDAFFLCVPLVRKRRVHFHHFMREIHRELDALKGTQDPIAEVAARTARRYRLVCFDEFHVSDIADAMILGRFLEQAMERGVEFVMTSNYPPDELYPEGLQRERFLPAIDLLKRRLDVVAVDNGTDYRRLKMERVRAYHVGPDAERVLEAIFAQLKDVEEERHPLDVEGREIPYRKRAGGLVWFDFAVLCGGARSYADYVDLARRFHTIILSGVPRLSPSQADAARRFTWLVDVLYDDRVKLVISAQAQPEALFPEGDNSAEFQRTVSRLHEMQSAAYRQSERRRSGAEATGEVQGVPAHGGR